MPSSPSLPCYFVIFFVVTVTLYISYIYFYIYNIYIYIQICIYIYIYIHYFDRVSARILLAEALWNSFFLIPRFGFVAFTHPICLSVCSSNYSSILLIVSVFEDLANVHVRSQAPHTEPACFCFVFCDCCEGPGVQLRSCDTTRKMENEWRWLRLWWWYNVGDKNKKKTVEN